ncbi:MAG TPA: hypothetical protein QGF40_07200 [Candidatus Marinimicrobia bacterium]|nr:hypothetical protein [Candidatus Neomarinimicrobiota bacterium]
MPVRHRFPEKRVLFSLPLIPPSTPAGVGSKEKVKYNEAAACGIGTYTLGTFTVND